MKQDARVQMVDLILGYQISQAVYVLAALGIPDLLENGSTTAAALAQATQTHAPALYRLLRFLTAVGVVARDSEGRFGPTALSATLRSNAPQSLHASALMCGAEQYEAFASLLHTIRTGESAFSHRFGEPFFAYLAGHPDALGVFTAAMSAEFGAFRPPAAVITDVFDFSKHRVIVDVGGGEGLLLASLLTECPHLEGVLFDLPDVAARAAAYLARLGLDGRCEIVAGSFFESLPQDGDVYLLSTVVHDWDDERALQILKSCRAAMDPGQVLLLFERVMDDGDGAAPAVFLDLIMMAITGGRERSEDEFRALLAAAGFHLHHNVVLDDRFHMLEAHAV